MKKIFRYVHDVASQLLKAHTIVKGAFTNPKSEASVVIGTVVSVLTAVDQVAQSGKIDWTAALGLIVGFLIRPQVSPAVDPPTAVVPTASAPAAPAA